MASFGFPNIATAGVALVPDATGFSSTLKKVAGGVIAAFAVKEIVQFGAATVRAATDLGESVNAVNTIFGEANQTILDFGKQAATQTGLSQSAFAQMAAETGALLTNFGLDQQAAADETIDLTKRAADLASIFNTDVSEALGAVQAGLRGETEPLRRFGVSLDDATVRAKAVEMGLAATTAEVDKGAKAQAALALFYEQTNKVQGDFVDTSGDLANAQRVLTAQFEDMKAEVGAALLPAIKELLPAVGALIPVVGDVLGAFAPLVTTLIKTAAPILEKVSGLFEYLAEALGPVIESLAEALAPILDVIVEVFGEVLEALLPVVVILVEALVPVIDLLAGALRLLAPVITWVADLLAAVLGPVLTVIGDAIEWVTGLFGGGEDAMKGMGAQAATTDERLAKLGDTLITDVNPPLAETGTTATETGVAVEAAAEVIEKSLVEVAGEAVEGFVSIFSTAADDVEITAGEILTNVQDAVDRQARFTTAIATLAASGMDAIVAELLAKGPAAVGEAEALAGDLVTAFNIEAELDAVVADDMTSLIGAVGKYGDQVNLVFTELGGEVGIGLAQGIVASQGHVTKAMQDTIDLAERVARLRGKMESPSQLFADRVGLPIAQGIAQGITAGSQTVGGAVSGIIDAATLDRLAARIETAVLQARAININATAEGSRDLARGLADELRFEAL